ncbi:uncharacterized protein LOC116196985 isoform X1 [Punica granatum]|uniref:Uncharacterized protein LOC116196985 isoform X1 n=1 Tax=Punica granatum TaxID=22663 RepID=A0A6P8CN94_PUNGR|nr:uncharacterized protein LOC116196985 isoform X1 [Punica granatum]
MASIPPNMRTHLVLLSMASIPPNMRTSDGNANAGRRPTPEMSAPQRTRNLNLGSLKPKADRSGKIVYANSEISKRFAIGLDKDRQVPASVVLELILVDHVEQIKGEKPLALVRSNAGNDGGMNRDNL